MLTSVSSVCYGYGKVHQCLDCTFAFDNSLRRLPSPFQFCYLHHSYLICPIPFFPSEAFVVILGDEFVEE